MIELRITVSRSVGVIAPSRLCGGAINARRTIPGVPFSSSIGDQRFSNSQLGDRGLDIDLRVLPEGCRSRLAPPSDRAV
jgi:hypothetical protein